MDAIKKYLDYPYLFLLVGLWMGVRMVYVNPPWQSNDEDRHFYNAYALTTGQIGTQYRDGKAGLMLPADLYRVVHSFQGIPFRDGTKLNEQYLQSFKNQRIKHNSEIMVQKVSARINPIGYIPASIGIGLAKSMNKPILDIGYWARLFSLFGYLAIVFVAIRFIPAGFKGLLTLFALTPMMLYQAASVGYDMLTNAVLLLYLALVVKFTLGKQSLNWRHVALFIGLAVFQRFVKDGYFLLYFSVLAIPFSRFEKKSMPWALLLGLIAASFLPGWIWSTYLESKGIPDEAKVIFQKDFHFNLRENLKFHLEDTGHFIQVLIGNTLIQGKVWLHGIIGRFGYSYSLLPEWQVIAWYLMILLVSSVPRPSLGYVRSGIIGLLGFATIASIIAGFLLSSAIGADYIFGLQGRYLSIAIPFVVIAFMNNGLLRVPDTYVKWGLFAASFLLLYLSIEFMDETFYTP